MRILLDGGCGFIGSHAADYLSMELKHKVFILDNLSTGRKENLEHEYPLMIGDIANINHVQEAFDRFAPDAVVHLAAQAAISTSWEFPDVDARTNILGTLNLICACKKYNVERMVFSSTSAVYDVGDMLPLKESQRVGPDSPYGISKLTAETYIRTLLPGSVILRLGNVYGLRQVPLGENQVVPRMIRHFENGDVFAINGDGEQKRDFVYVSDVAHAISCALHGEAGTYNIAGGQSTTVNQLAAIMESIYEVPGYNWLHTNVNDPRRDNCLDIARAKKGLNWEPGMGLWDGLRETVTWWKMRGKE
jgi:nucleoside-diphosphate-sugar epimerase